MGIQLDTSQVRALAARIGTAGPRIGVRAAAILRRTAFAIEADAKVLAPVDTGNLRNSISTTFSGDGRSGSMAAEVGPTAEYGIYQEYGTSTQPGQPYLAPAFDRHAAAYGESLAQALADEVL